MVFGDIADNIVKLIPSTHVYQNKSLKKKYYKLVIYNGER